jgi:hypothetical protein
MAATLERNGPLDEACRLVGMFLKHYAIMEQALDLAIGKLLGLQGATIDIISASIPVAKKVDVLLSAEKFLAAIPEKGRENFLEKTRKDILKLNNDRVIIAHCPFEPGPDGGVSFRRVVVTSGQLKITNVTSSLEEVESKCELAVELADALNGVVAEMKPYEPSLDFSDSRNSMYIPLIL